MTTNYVNRTEGVDERVARARTSLAELFEAARTLSIPHGSLRRMSLKIGDTEVELEWDETASRPPGVAVPAAVEPPVRGGGEEETRLLVAAPMVGTFYVAPEPGATPFVKVGDEVVPGQQVGIVEAMKLMNQVVAEVPGRVVEVLVTDGSSVEYAQPLLALAPVG